MRAICLDLDGTLYDARPVRQRMALRLVVRHLLRPASGYKKARILAAYRRALETLRHEECDLSNADVQIELCCRMTGHCDEEVRTCVKEWFEETPLDLLRTYMRPGLVEFLRAARSAGIKLAVFSDYPVQSKLHAMGVDRFFDCAASAADLGIRRLKPDPAGLRFVMKTLDVDATSSVYVGDRPEVDAEAARRAGMRAFIVGHSRPHSHRWTAVRDFSEFKSLIGII